MNKKEKGRVHKDLEGLSLSVNSFGEIKSNVPIDTINEFLNEKVEDKKLKNRDNLDSTKKKGNFPR